MDNAKTCCFTGHRSQGLPFGFDEERPACKQLKALLHQEIERLITECGVTHFISGMALGIDQIAAELVLELKKSYPEITLECALPCETQAARWSIAQRERYYTIVSRCDVETLLQTSYTADCMQKRNRYMVDQSRFVIAVWNGRPSGTGSTVRYAKEQGKQLIIIDPNTINTNQYVQS